MSDLERILLTSGLTVIGGVIVLVIGQIIIRFIVDPIILLRISIGEIAHVLDYHENIYENPGIARNDLQDRASDALREKACLLESRSRAVPLYGLFERLGAVPARKEIAGASGGLIRLSNSVHRGNFIENHDKSDEIRSLLKLNSIEKAKRNKNKKQCV
jgi:hypothetical protein